MKKTRRMSNSTKILIIGGGIAGARVAQDLVKAGFDNVTLIDRKDYFEVTYSTLRTLAQPEMGKRARMQYKDFINSRFQLGDVTTLAKDYATLSDGKRTPFDVAVIATGSSYRTFPIAKTQDALLIGERKIEFDEEHTRLESAEKILVIGGGTVGVELAGEIADHYPSKSVTLAEGGERLLAELKPKASKVAHNQLKALGVNILYNTHLSSDDADYQNADVVYMCVGQVPNTGLMKESFSDKIDETGLIKVDATMCVEGMENIFALGDCSTIATAKMGYLADIQAALLAKNITSAARGGVMKRYKQKPMMALVSIGRTKGVAQIPLIGVSTLCFIVNIKQKDMLITHQYEKFGIKR